MATFTKRGDKWFVQIRRKGFPTSCRSFRQKSDADEWARHMEIKADRGDLPTPIKELGKHTVRSILERYRDEISVKKKSHDNERHILNALMRQPFADLSLAEITATKFADYRDMRMKSVKAGTVRRELALLKHAFDIAGKVWGLPVRENPLDKLPKIRPQAGRTRRLEEGEFDKIVQAAQSNRNLLILAQAGYFREGISPQHKQAFKVICKALNAKVDGNSTGLDVLAFPTGAGKTKALEYYSFKTSASVLIATRRTDDADKIAENINVLAHGQEVACAAHSKNHLELDAIREFRVLVITHEAFKRMVLRSDPYHAALNNYLGQERQLHVIDESMNIFETEELTLLQAKIAVEALAPKDAEAFKPILQRMEQAEDFLRPSDWRDFDIRSLPSYNKKGTRLDYALLKRNDLALHDDLSAFNAKTIKILRNVPRSVCRVTKGKDGRKFSIARVALPFSQVNAIVLDATANQNVQYRLLRQGVNIIQPPEGIRVYNNVTLYVSYGHKIGRVHLEKTSSKMIPSVLKELPSEIQSAKNVLICTHSNIENAFLGYEGLPFYDVAHFGAIDGRNDWNQHDAMLIFGLPYIPPHALEAQALALEVYRGKKLKLDKVTSLLNKSAIITQVIQAINRIRCRNVLSDGSCESSSIRLFLPNGELGQELMAAIKRAMPSIQIVELESSISSRKVRRSKYEEPLIALLASLPSGGKYMCQFSPCTPHAARRGNESK